MAQKQQNVESHEPKCAAESRAQHTVTKRLKTFYFLNMLALYGKFLFILT